ncbi:MAG: alkaline phosphatase family protein [Candidatus Baltobacteraceae bacterium]
MTSPRLAALAMLLVLAACAQAIGPNAAARGVLPAQRALGSSKVDHVIIIVQENRSVDNLFNALPGAQTTQYGLNSNGKRVRLQPISLTAPYDISHEHSAFQVEFNGGNLNGFNLVESHCQRRENCPLKGQRSYGYVPQSEVQPYYTMATQYAFADHMFETNQGPSFPAHQYLLSGTSTIKEGSSLRAAENPLTPDDDFTGGCDSPRGSLVWLIDSSGNEDREAYPCFDRPALSDLLEAHSLSWRYYQERTGAGLWHGPDAIKHIWKSPDFKTNVVTPPSQVLADISSGHLATVAWVTPTAVSSDHAGTNDGSGPSWVASVVNAVGKSSYWNDTVIFVVWDDWGGWYDHIVPPSLNAYELGFRVPLIAISPYAKRGYVSHKQHEFGSILKFVEEAFELGSLGTTDVRSDDLADFFDFSQQPRRFKPIAARYPPAYFLRQRGGGPSPDDDY